MKNVTTLKDKDRLANVMDVELSDFEDEDEEDRPNLAQQLEQKPIDKTLTLRDFDEYTMFLAPLLYAGLEAERFCNEKLSSCFGSNIYVASALQLDLFQKALIEQGAEIPMDQICELCFREEENISSVAFAYVKSQLSRNMALGTWVWSYESIINVLPLFGCDEICTPCAESEVWSVENSIIRGSDAGPVSVYVDNEAHHYVGVLLKLIELSYSRPHDIISTTLGQRQDAAKLLVALMRLTADATIQELYPEGVWSATEAVLAYCRRIETSEYPSPAATIIAADVASSSASSADVSEPVAPASTTVTSSEAPPTNLTNTSSPINPAYTVKDIPLPSSPHHSPPPAVPSESYPANFFHSPSQRDSQSQSQASHLFPSHSPLRPTLPALITPHATSHASTHTSDPNESLAAPPAGDSPDQEESQLSSQLHYASICGSPSADAYVDAAEGAGVGTGAGSGVGGGCSGYNGESNAGNVIARSIFQSSDDTSPVLPPDTTGVDHGVDEGVHEAVQEVEFVYSAEKMHALPAEGMSVVLLRALVGMVQCRDVTLLTLVNAAHVLSVSGDPAYQGLWEFFVRALLQYRVAPYFPELEYTCAPCVDVSGSGGGRESSVCACMVEYITILTSQQRAYTNSPDTVSLWSDIRAVRAYFKLVAQYVLCSGLEATVEDLESLEDACKTFRAKTTCMEMEDIIDSILAYCAMYLD